MGAIKAADVAKLRKQSGAGMMDCKNALVEANGDFDAAINVLRKKGQKVAANRADREASEGVATTKINSDKTSGVAIVLACETDFVAKNDSFKELASDFANIALNHNDKESFLAADFGGMSVADKLIEQTGVIGEKLQINAFEKVEAPFVGSYIHAGNKIATIVGLSSATEGADVVAKDVAMQAAAMNPIALNENEVDASVIEKEIEIAKDQLRAEGKPEAMLDNIAKGKIKRFFKDNTLVNQAFIKDSKQSVAAYVKTIGDVNVTGFKRVALG